MFFFEFIEIIRRHVWAVFRIEWEVVVKARALPPEAPPAPSPPLRLSRAAGRPRSKRPSLPPSLSRRGLSRRLTPPPPPRGPHSTTLAAQPDRPPPFAPQVYSSSYSSHPLSSPIADEDGSEETQPLDSNQEFED